MSIQTSLMASPTPRKEGEWVKVQISPHLRVQRIGFLGQGEGGGGGVREQGKQLLHQEGCMVAAHLSNFFF